MQQERRNLSNSYRYSYAAFIWWSISISIYSTHALICVFCCLLSNTSVEYFDLAVIRKTRVCDWPCPCHTWKRRSQEKRLDRTPCRYPSAQPCGVVHRTAVSQDVRLCMSVRPGVHVSHWYVLIMRCMSDWFYVLANYAAWYNVTRGCTSLFMLHTRTATRVTYKFSD